MKIGQIGDYILLAWVIYMVLSKLVVIYKKVPKGMRVPVIDINGVIQYSDQQESLFKRTMKSLEDVEHQHAKALILCVNSPGGSVGATHEIYAKLMQLKKEGVKIVAMLEDVAASGGLYIAMAADYVVATPGTITGSIGVIMNSYDVSELLPLLKIKSRTFKSGPFKDMGSPMRASTEAEDTLLNEIVTDVLEGFCGIIADSRGLDRAVVREFADGRILTGRQALEVKLIDEIGSFEDAIQMACELANIPEGKGRLVPFVHRRPFLKELLAGVVPGGRTEALANEVLPGLGMQGLPLLLMRRL